MPCFVSTSARGASAVLALVAASSALAAPPRTMIKGGDAIAGSTVADFTNVVCNRGTGFIAGVNDAAGFSHFFGSVSRGNGAVLRTEGVFPPYTQTSFESFFGFGNAGQIAYSPTVTGGVIATGGDSVFVDDTPIAVEGNAVTSIPGQFWRFGSRPTSTSSGEAFWVGGLTATSGGSTQQRGLFRGTGISVIRSGDAVGGVAETMNTTTAVSFDYGVSGNGNNYIIEANLAATSAIDTAVVINGAVVVAGGALVREGTVIPAAIGGNDGFVWQNFDFMGINNAGRYFFTGDNNDATTADEFIVRDGRIVIKDGDVLDGQTLQGDIEMAAMNEQGDLGFIWDINANITEALYLNRRLVVKEGDPMDLDNSGATDTGSAIVDFTNISCLGVSGRDGGRVDVYFTANVDTDADLSTTADRVEGVFRAAVCLPDVNNDGSLSVQDIFDFLTLWFSADLRADYTNDFTITVQDIFDFLGGWFAGCPA